MNHPERINKVLAGLGYGSRREVDALINSHAVTVNGQPAKLGQRVLPEDNLTVQGAVVNRTQPKTLTIAFHKPMGVTTTKRDRFAKVTVMDYLPLEYRHLYPVGRLDRMSRGLLILTNDGELAQQLTHPRYGHEKEYSVIIRAREPKSLPAFKADIDRLSRTVLDKSIQSTPVTIQSATFDPKRQEGKITLILKEGKKRQIRRMFAIVGYDVVDLLRTRINQFALGDLPVGKYRTIDSSLLL